MPMPVTVLEDRMVTAPEKAVVFMSRREHLKLVLKRKQELKDAEGNVRETIQGEHLKFEKGVLRIPPRGPMRGEFGEDLDAAEVLTHLLGDEEGRLPHPLLGDRFDGFWEHKEPPPLPTTEEREAMAELAIALDANGLRRYVSEEEAGWARPALLTEARASLKRVEERLAERQAELDAARAEGAAEAQRAKEGKRPS